MTTEAAPKRRTWTQERGDQRKARIIAAAMQLYGQRGYQSTSLEDIASAVGITRAGLLHHFGSKEHLLWAVLEERDRRGDRSAEPLIGMPGLSFIDSMLPIMDQDRLERELVQLYAVLVGENVPETKPAHEHFRSRYETLGNRALQLLEAGQDAGEIRADVNLRNVEPLLGAVVEGLLLRWLYQPEAVDLVEAYRVFAESMKAYLRSPGQAATGRRAGRARTHRARMAQQPDSQS